MSRLWGEELRVALLPDQIVMVGIKAAMTRRGLKPQVHIRESIPCASVSKGEANWIGVIKSLENALSLFANRKMQATAIISNHFMHYAVVPWSDALNSEAEEMAFAQHFFREKYGPTADAWELRISTDKAGEPQLASAMETNFLFALRELFKGKGISLRSIQPNLMAVCNGCSHTLRGRNAWVACVEPGNLCLSLLRHGKWSWMKTMRISEDWHDELPLILEREAFLASSDAPTNDVYLWSMDGEDQVIPINEPWQIQYLKPAVVHGDGPEKDGRFSMAMSRGS